MINLILIPLLLHYIGLYVFKPKMNALNCGIGGYIGNNFDKQKFNILGLYNDTRGGDSCGVFVNNQGNTEVRYGHDKTKLYKAFVESGGLKDIELNSINLALLHCRKASVGGIGLVQAQPVVIKDENENIIFSMIHNGTLVNYKELAIKYNVDFSLIETDSQIFCKTVYKAGYNVLSEYDGAGAFVFWDSRDGNDTIKIFKGASLYYENDKSLYIERPLFFINEENSFWFSSMEESLNFINDTDAKVENLKSNILFTIKNGKIISEIEIDRSDRKQSEKLMVDWEKQRAQNLNNFPARRYANEYIDYDSYFEEEYGYSQHFNTQGSKQFWQNFKTDKIELPGYEQKDKIYFNDNGLYYINGAPCDGAIEAAPNGYTGVLSIKKNIYYFISGILMSSYFDYLCAKQFVSQNFDLVEDDCMEIYLAAYSPTPVPWVVEDGNSVRYIEFYGYSPILGDNELYDGYFEPFFAGMKIRYAVQRGEITWCYKYNNSSSFYEMSEEKAKLDNEILSGKISKNSIRKMIKKNLKQTYARN